VLFDVVDLEKRRPSIAASVLHPKIEAVKCWNRRSLQGRGGGYF